MAFVSSLATERERGRRMSQVKRAGWRKGKGGEGERQPVLGPLQANSAGQCPSFEHGWLDLILPATKAELLTHYNVGGLIGGSWIKKWSERRSKNRSITGDSSTQYVWSGRNETASKRDANVKVVITNRNLWMKYGRWIKDILCTGEPMIQYIKQYPSVAI